MSIFRRESRAPAEDPAAVAAGAGVTRIAAGSRVLGEVTGATEVLVEGEVRGAIRVDATVTVAAGGLVEGPIAARVVRVAGKVVGDVRGADRVEVGVAAVLEGDIAAPRVVISEGAFFKGMIQMQGDKARDGRSPVEATAAATVEPGNGTPAC